ncbi:MAG: biopolymer transporter ExbD [Bacteroidota bacterium]
MAIKSHYTLSTGFSIAALPNLVFLLLIFFLLTSTLISPNAIKLVLPSASSRLLTKQSTSVYINEQNRVFVNEAPVTNQDIKQKLTQSLIGQPEGVIVIHADRSVPVQYVVNVMDAVNQINEILKTRHQVILATTPSDRK